MNKPVRFWLNALFALAGVVAAVVYFKATQSSDGGQWGIFGTAEDRDPGPPTQESRALDSFSRIDVESAGVFDVTVGKPQTVAVEGTQRMLQALRTDVRNGTLVIHSESGTSHHFGRHSDAHFTIAVESLSAVEVDGAARFVIHDLRGPSFEFRSAGASDLIADGAVDSLRLRIEGASHADTRKVSAKNVTVDVDGVGAAQVQASDLLEASIHGVGKISYTGHPAIVKKDTSGIGNIHSED